MNLKVIIFIIMVIVCALGLPKAYRQFKEDKNVTTIVEFVSEIVIIICGVILIIAEYTD